MLIPFSDLVAKYNIRGGKILHIGAHHCEERADYASHGYDDSKVVWLEGNPATAQEAKKMYPQAEIYSAVVSDRDNQEVEFIITNNGQSSSILELDEHKREHPWVWETGRVRLRTVTVDSLFRMFHVNPSQFHFLNMDIQGAELLALKGMSSVLPYIKYAYLEVNEKHLYKDCALIPEIDAFLGRYGFVRQETAMTQYGWGDAFYVKH